MRIEEQAGHLGVAVDGREFGAGVGVEEVDAPVVAAAAGSDERGLPRGEGDGFASGLEGEQVFLAAGADGEDGVLSREGEGRGQVAAGAVVLGSRCQHLFGIEKEEVVVVAAGGEEVSIRAPGHAADLLGMASDLCQ